MNGLNATLQRRLAGRRWLSARGYVVAVLAAGLWAFASYSLDRGVMELLIFIAPAASLTLLASWSSHALRRDDYDWSSSLRAAVAGALLLPPCMGALVAALGPFHPERQLVLLLIAPWVMLLVGAASGIVIGLLNRSH